MDRPHIAITGASSGIGEALARAWLLRGAAVTVVARRRGRLEALAEHGKVHVVEADLSVPARAADWVDGAIAALGPIEVLVNNAGAQLVGPTESLDCEASEKMLALDLLSPLRITRDVLPRMLARGRGTLVDVASMAALAPTPGMLYYNAAKAGLAAASESLRGELRGTGVHVVTVYPGPVDTELARASMKKAGDDPWVRRMPIGTVDGLARLVVHAVEDRTDRVIYPAPYALSRHFPNITRWFMDRFTPRFDGGG